MARLIRTNGQETQISPKNGKQFSVTEINELIDGYFEVIRCERGLVMLVNEDGRLIGLPPNVRARGYLPLFVGQVVGDVLVGTHQEFGV